MSYPKKPLLGSKDRDAYTSGEVNRNNKKDHLKTLLIHRMKSLLSRNHNVEMTQHVEDVIRIKTYQFVDHEDFSENGLKGLVDKILAYLNGEKQNATTDNRRQLKKSRNSHLEGIST
jgi:hypothetical protein